MTLIKLNRPEQENALDKDAYSSLREVLLENYNRWIVIYGAGN